MKLVSFPYCWRWGTIWKNISHVYWDLKNGLRNIPLFFEAVWWFRAWDWTGMVELLEISAREMRDVQTTGRHTGSERSAKQLMVIQNLCRRLREENYFDMHGDEHDRTWAERVSYSGKNDAEYLGRMMRFVQYWWE